jgi:hypothetical protein
MSRSEIEIVTTSTEHAAAIRVFRARASWLFITMLWGLLFYFDWQG